MHLFLLALTIGLVCGLRTMMGPAAVSWAARLQFLPLANTSLAFLGYAATPYIFTALALGELIGDKLPRTPSRKTPPQFLARVVTGSLSGAAIGAANRQVLLCFILGALGAILGTLGGAKARSVLARAMRRDWAAALLEDALAIVLAFTAFAVLA